MRELFKIILMGFGLLPSVAVAATDAEIITQAATKCWKVPADASYTRASATFEVTYDGNGEITDIVTVEYQPVRKAGEEFAVSAQNAILECANKTTVRSRTVRIVMRYAQAKSDGPLIMKRKLR